MKNIRQPRQYLQFSNTAVSACIGAIESFNKVHGDYKVETTLILLTNAWELLAKAILVKNHKKIISTGDRKKTMSCRKTIKKLLELKEIEEDQAVLLQQIVSLRDQSIHGILPQVPEAIQHHLFFFGCKFFKELSIKHFPKTERDLRKNFLTISFDKLTTYSAEIKRIVSKLRRTKKSDKELIWLLERGIRYADQGEYISQNEFEKLYKNRKKKIMPHLAIGNYIDNEDMVRIVPVQAPRNYAADIQLRKGPRNSRDHLPVTIKKSNIEEEYPYLTGEIAKKIGKSIPFVAKMAQDLNLKGDPAYHVEVRASKSGGIQRYSEKALIKMQDYVRKNPNYNPLKKNR